jgi:cytochrome c5
VSGPSNDKHFFDTFMLVLGILVIVAFGLYFGASAISSSTQEANALEDPLLKASVAERIAPIGKVAVSGEDNSAVEEKVAAPVALKDMPGEEVFNTTCVACHGSGLAGAPKVGDKAAWAPRVAEGADTLHQHAINGFTGKSGVMPAKGGMTSVTDASIMAAVDYMVGRSK